jgi:hypothetical protein
LEPGASFYYKLKKMLFSEQFDNSKEPEIYRSFVKEKFPDYLTYADLIKIDRTRDRITITIFNSQGNSRGYIKKENFSTSFP